jgi:predicted nucleotidyltransferase
MVEQFFNIHAKEYCVTLAFLYGSWAHGLQRNNSDIDIAIMIEESDEDEIFQKITAMTLALSELLQYEANGLYIDHDLSRPMLHYNAIVKGIPVYFDDFTYYVDVRMKAIAQMEDFSIFGLTWQKQIIENNLKDLTNA